MTNTEQTEMRIERLEVYRRHTPECLRMLRAMGSKVPENGLRAFVRCPGKRPCPCYVDGLVNGKRIRKGLGRDYARACDRVREIERSRGRAPATELIIGGEMNLAQMVEAYLKTRKVAPNTLRRYTRLLRALVAFTGPDPDLDSERFTRTLEQFIQSQAFKTDNTIRLAMITVRSFFTHCVERGWIKRAWSRMLEMPDKPEGQTLPFTEHEVSCMLGACDQLPEEGELTRQRARALLLAMLYTGLRVSDVVQLRRDRIDSQGRILICTQKTGRRIFLPLKPVLIEALRELPESPRLREGYFFWSAKAELSSACAMCRVLLKMIEKHAGVPDVRPHRFRDTFALAVLDLGLPLDALQLLLGHASVETTARYYRHFSLKQQRIMDEAVNGLNFGQEASVPPIHPLSHGRRNAQRNVVTLRTPA